MNDTNPQQAQLAEVRKYDAVYRLPEYRMGDARRRCAEDNLHSVGGFCHSLLDVGCGRGEMVRYAQAHGWRAQGVEAVDYLTDGQNVLWGHAWDLPVADKSFDLVTLFDVIEHILPEDCDRTLAELARVAKKHLFITAANYSSQSLGVELHVNRLPYETWDQIFRAAFPGAAVEWLPRRHGTASETWSIALCP